MEKTNSTRFKHFTNSGDLIATMASFKAFYELSQRKVIVCQQVGVRANYYQGATHETRDDAGEMVCMNQKIYDKIRPLILSQDYIEDMEPYVGQPIQVDIDVIRKKNFVNIPHGSIQAWPFYAYPDLAFDLTRPWIELSDSQIPPKIKKQVKGKVVLNFTERYRNGHVNYYFLKKYQSNLIFAGTDREHLLFCNTFNINIPKLQEENFLDTAYALKACKFFLGNQSFCWNLAEALKVPRILEVCEYAQNCLPFYGKKSYGFFHQEGLEYYFGLLY